MPSTLSSKQHHKVFFISYLAPRDPPPPPRPMFQVFSDWVTQTIRLRRGATHAELEWSVGPIPVGRSSDGNGGAAAEGLAGKEVISRFSAPSLTSDGVFHTDANGREFQRRVRNERPTWDLDVTQPVAGNYYPVTAAAFVRDEGGGDDGIQVSSARSNCHCLFYQTQSNRTYCFRDVCSIAWPKTRCRAGGRCQPA